MSQQFLTIPDFLTVEQLEKYNSLSPKNQILVVDLSSFTSMLFDVEKNLRKLRDKQFRLSILQYGLRRNEVYNYEMELQKSLLEIAVVSAEIKLDELEIKNYSDYMRDQIVTKLDQVLDRKYWIP